MGWYWNRCHLPDFRCPRKANPIRLAPRRINDHDSFPFPKIFPPLTSTSPEEEGMMNKTRDRTKVHMANHDAPFCNLVPMSVSFHYGWRSYVSILEQYAY